MTPIAEQLASCEFKREPYTIKAAQNLTVYFREWSGADTDWWIQDHAKRFPRDAKPGQSNHVGRRAAMIARTLVDKDGVPAYDPNDTATVNTLREEVIDELFTAMHTFHRLDSTDDKKKE